MLRLMGRAQPYPDRALLLTLSTSDTVRKTAWDFVSSRASDPRTRSSDIGDNLAYLASNHILGFATKHLHEQEVPNRINRTAAWARAVSLPQSAIKVLREHRLRSLQSDCSLEWRAGGRHLILNTHDGFSLSPDKLKRNWEGCKSIVLPLGRFARFGHPCHCTHYRGLHRSQSAVE
jgi:hypothetical protein